jgi:UDP-N-acetylmuramoylalanine-D-glutamate ligase
MKDLVVLEMSSFQLEATLYLFVTKTIPAVWVK